MSSRATNVRPLGYRILVRPDPLPKTTESGFVIPDTYEAPSMSGSVIARGDGWRRGDQIRRLTFRRCVDIVDELSDQFPNASEFANALRDELGRCMACPDPVHLVDVGQRVVFGPYSGQEVVERDAGAVVVLEEDDVLAVVEPQEVNV